MNTKPTPPFAADVMEAAGFCLGLARSDRDFNAAERAKLRMAGQALDYFVKNVIWSEPKKKKKP